MEMFVPVPTSRDEVVVETRQISGGVTRIGIVDDNLDPALVEGVIEGLNELLPGATVRNWIKPSGTAPAPNSIIDEMVGEVDLAIAAIAMCGSCTAGVVMDAARLHKKGVPTIAISWEIFERAARSMANLQGAGDLPLAIIQKVEVGDTPDDQRAKGRACARLILDTLGVTPLAVG